MATLFDNLGEPLIKGPGHTQDYQVTAGERFAEEWERGLEFNPVAYLGRQARFAVERNAPFFGLPSNMVSKEAAHEELKSRGLEGMITVGDEGISRTEFDMLQYIKQREINQQGMASAPQSFFSHAAGFAGSFAAGAVDPINIASAFIPIVPEARYAAWLAKAGTSFGARAGARATAGAIEGAVGAAMIEPFMYMGAQAEQRDYGVADSMMNIVFGTLLGGGLHTVGGAVYDWRMGRVMRSLDQGIQGLGLRDVASEASDQSQLDALRRFVEAEEAGVPPPDAERILREGLTPEVKADMEASRTMPDEVPEARRADGQPPSPRGLTDLIDEAKADRTAEVFNRQFIDKEQRGEPLTGDVRAPREDIFEVAQANFVGATKHTAKTVPIEQLTGGVSKDPAETKRVQNLVDLMRGPAGFIERLIVDSRGNVIEGQHRLEALRQMGVKEVPVIEISELREGLPVEQMSEAIRSVRTTREEHVNQLIDRIAEAVADVGSIAEVRAQYEAPAGFERQWAAALDAAEAADDLKAQSDVRSKIAGGKFYDDEFGSIENVLQGFESGELLVHARAKDGTDFQYGIDPRNGDFLKSTDSYASYVDAIRSEDPDAEPAELTFFSGVESGPVTSWADFFAKSGKQIELVFVRKSGDIQKSLGDGKVMTADGKVMPYDRSPLADYDNPAMRDEPGGVEPGDWYTDKTVDVVAVLDVDDEAASMKAQSAPAKDAWGKFTEAFWRWFKGSKVVDADGNPLVVYHGTYGDFSEFSYGSTYDIGWHFGSKGAANDIIAEDTEWKRRAMKERGIKDPKFNIMPVYLKITNPYRMDDTGAGWSGETILYRAPLYRQDKAAVAVVKERALIVYSDMIKEMSGVSIEPSRLQNMTGGQLENATGLRDTRGIYQKAVNEAVRADLEARGYDGIVYKNEYEGKAEDSYLALRPTQIKSATGNIGTFDIGNPDIRFNRDFVPSAAAGAPIEGVTPEERERNLRRFMGGLPHVKDGADYKGGGAVFDAWHGTTHDITAFRKSGRIDNFLGLGPYFTTSRRDADANYAGEGPDLTLRISREEENIAQSFDDDEFAAKEMIRDYLESIGSKMDVDDYDLDFLADQYRDKAIAFEARRQAKGENDGFLMRLYVKLENPADATGKSAPLTYEAKFDEDGNFVSESGTLLEWVDATREVADEFNATPDAERYIAALMEEGGDVDFKTVFDKTADFFDQVYDPDTGDNLGTGAMFREIAERAGYDGVIMDADRHFGTGRRGFAGTSVPGMEGVYPGTLHIVPFKSGNIKSATGNRGTFDAAFSDIRANRDLDNAPKKFPYQHDAQSRDIGTELMQSMNSSDGAPLAVEVGVPGMRPAREPLVMADGPDAPKVIGTDAAGRPVLDFRDSVVSHFTDEESAADINSNGYRVVGDGYYGEAISFTPNREFGRQFGSVETVARIAPDARILNTGLDADAKIIMSVLNDRRLVPNNPRLGQKTWRQAFLDLGVDGLYDPGAGDLFIYNAAKVWPVAKDRFADLKAMIGSGRAAQNSPKFKRWFGDSKVVDADGNPLVVYHGTGESFDEFADDFSGSAHDSGALGRGFYFTNETKIADFYAGYMELGNPNVMPVYLSLQNPLVVVASGRPTKLARGASKMQDLIDQIKRQHPQIDLSKYYIDDDLPSQFSENGNTSASDDIRRMLERLGYDGVIYEFSSSGGAREFVAFEPTQIKSATGNRGTYDPELADIRAQRDFDAAVPRVDDLSASTPSDYRRMLDYFGPEYADAPVIGPKGDILFNAIDQESLGGPAIMVKEDGSVVAGIVAWHGSPHDFDRFDITKIGTGEGAQAYGHGLYFAEARRVGQKYKDMLSDMATALPGLDWKERADWTELQDEAYGLADHALEELQIDITQGGSERPTWQRVVDKVRNLAPAGREKDILRELDALADKYGWKDYVNNNPGRLYLNFLAVRPEELLDWDRPLSEQPKFLQEFARTVDLSHLPSGSKTRRQIEMWREGTLPNKESEPTANVLHSAITDYGMDAQKNAEFAQQLKAAGVKGARYFDRDSRSLGNGTRNIVLFDDDLIGIIDKFQKDLDEQPDLVAAHNLTSANLLHADKMGGLAAPSLAIAKASDGHEGYGEITLIGSKDLVDPQKGAKVYAGDIYSARYPTVHYNIKYDAIRKLEKKFAATAKEMGVTVRESLDDDALEREGPRALENSVGAMLTYAKEKGISVEGYVFDHDAWEVRNRAAQAKERAIRDEWNEKRDAERERAQAEGRDPDETAIDDEFQPKYMEARREAISILREPDRALDEVKWKLRDKFRGDDQFLEWAAEKFAELKAKERIFKGFSDRTGGKMYAPHTLDNVVRLMTKKIRDAEGFNYGIGNLRAKVAPKFKSVEAIQGRKGSLVSRQEFDAIKKEADAELTAVAEQLLPKAKYKGNTFGQMDALTQHMAEAIDRGNVKRVLQEYYNGITDDDVRMVGNFLQKLKSMPTTYFEAKLDRAVSIGEFEAAVVPNTITKKAREVLERSGVKQIVEYDPKVEGARQAAIDSIRDLKFQLDNDLRSKGFYSVLERSLQETTIKKASGKDWKGWLANRPGIKADEMEYTGLDDFLTLNQDAMLTKEEVLAHVKDNAVQIVENSFGDRAPPTSVENDPAIRAEYQPEVDRLTAERRAISQKADDLAKDVGVFGPFEVRQSNGGGWFIVDRRGEWGVTEYKTKADAETALGEANDKSVEIRKLNEKSSEITRRIREIQEEIQRRSVEKATQGKTFTDIGPGKWEQYVIGDGLNYRELVFEWANPPEDLKQRPFAQAHHERDNILAHARVVDRPLPDGGMAAHAEELQSDWHQKGRDFGYYKPLSKKDARRLSEIDAALDKSERELMDLYDTIGVENGYKNLLEFERAEPRKAKAAMDDDPRVKKIFADDNVLIAERDKLRAAPERKPHQVPDAPFKKNWVELVLKRLIRYAAENGYSELLITPGVVQAERYDLTTAVDSIRAFPLADDIWQIQGIKDGNVIVDGIEVHRDDLAQEIGKKAAKQILETPTRKFKDQGGGATVIADAHELVAPDLRIGGWGMIEFYDEIVVRFLNTFGKKYGAKTGTRSLTLDYEAGAGSKVQQTWDLHRFPITEALREQAMKGMPLFQKDGTEGGGAVPSPGKRVTMAPVIKRSGKYAYEEMSSERAARSEKLREEVEALIDKYTGGRVGKRWVSSMRVKQGTQMMKVDGGFSARGQLIIMALDAADMTGSVKHEAIHALKELGVLTDREWDILVRTALDNGWLDKKYGNSKKTIRERYWDLPLIDQVEEAIAEEFRIGRWDSFQGYPEAIRPALLKVREFFDRLAEIVRKIFGKEATAQDIFNAIERGEVGARQDVGGPVGEGPLTRGVPEDVRRSQDEAPPTPFDRWAADDAAIAAQAQQESQQTDETLQDIEAELALSSAHIESMRQRGLLSVMDEEALRESDQMAKMMEEQAAAYEAAGICEGEA